MPVQSYNYPKSYQEADEFLGKHRISRRLKGGSFGRVHAGFERMSIYCHDTAVVTFHKDGSITFDTGGWHTQTTARYINSACPPGFHVFMHKGTLYLSTPRGNQIDLGTKPVTYVPASAVL